MSVTDEAEGERETSKEFAVKLFEESLVNGVPNIIKTPSLARKVFKASVLLCCLCGFLYQTAVFLSFFLTFPCVVDFEVSTPTQVLTPAITFCNNNGIKRSKFCKKYPDFCENPGNMTTFCTKYPHYCHDLENWDSFKVPKPQYYDFESKVDIEELKELGHDLGSLLKDNFIFPTFATDVDNSSYIEGPLIFFKMDQSPFACYSIMCRVNSDKDPAFSQRNLGIPSFLPLLAMVLDFEESETFIPGRKAGGLLSVHSPFMYVNPHQNGQWLKPGKDYKIHYGMDVEYLLPWPYRTDCVNYTHRWLDNGRRGQRSQEMCKEECTREFLLAHRNCSPVYPSAYPSQTGKLCESFGEEKVKLNFDEYKTCLSLCKDDCERYKFVSDVQERLFELSRSFNGNFNTSKKRLTMAEFYSSDPEVVVLRYRPQYQNIEVFSYIGGYIGGWLGISFVAVMDLLESMSLLTVFVLRKRC